MKKTITLLVFAALLIGCEKKLTPMQQVAQGDPIQPVMLKMDSVSIVFTDYIPTLAGTEFDRVWLDQYDFTGNRDRLDLFIPNMFYSADRRFVHILTFIKGNDVVSVPVMPPSERKQSMYLKAIDKDNIHVAFTEKPDDIHFYMFWQNTYIPINEVVEDVATSECTFAFPADVKKKGRSFIRIYATDKNYLYNDILIPLEDMIPICSAEQLNRHDAQSQVLYSLMIDRFANGNQANDWKINSEEVLDIVDYQGGDLAGITKKINEGFFDKLGVSTIWISPITQNPYDAWGYYVFNDNGDGTYNNKYDPTRSFTKFTGYHGYWPIYATQIDKRFGTNEELKQLLATAHSHNLNVILDYVANHMHINAPLWQQHPDWMTDSILPDGRRNFELWDEARLTTWFDVHIPTLDLERQEVCDQMTDSAIYWIKNYDFDGFRHDACKHIPEAYWRTLTQKIKTNFADKKLWMIGETYGSPELIGSYIKSGMLDAQFDFNVYFTAIHALADEDGRMSDVARVIEESLAAYGAHHTMGNISGNHDQVRFISLAGGAVSFSEDGKAAGWSRQVGVGDKDKAFRLAMLLEALNLTIPGVPCIYQGDEYGQAGGNDPDNRHMMRFDGLDTYEASMRAEVERLIHSRRNSMAMMYGEYIPVYSDDDVLCFERRYLDDNLRVVINKASFPKDFKANGQTIHAEPFSFSIDKIE